MSVNMNQTAMTAADLKTFTKQGTKRKRAVIDKGVLAKVWREECLRDIDDGTTTAERVAGRIGSTASTVTQTVTQLRKKLQEAGYTETQAKTVFPFAPKFGRPAGSDLDLDALACAVGIELPTDDKGTETAPS
jgi:hypothetical protein